MIKRIALAFCFCLILIGTQAQEFNARVSVIAGQISSKVDRRVFQTLQTALTNFMNSRKWSNANYQQQERITCNFLITLNQELEANVYKGTLTIQAGRPIYNSGYMAPLLNYQDNDVSFKYVENQLIEFNENRIQGTDPAASNLSAVLAFYAYVILGLDHDSFAPRGGDPYFQRAQLIVTGAPDGRNITGWTAFDNLRNRYWLSENLTNSKYSLIHDACYTYYRLGLDKMYEDENEARQQVINALNSLNTLFADNPNLFFIQFFFLGKVEELIGLYKKAAPQQKQRVAELLARLDVSNAGRYKQELR